MTTLVSIGISYWVYRRRWDVQGAQAFVILLVVGGIWWQLLTALHVLSSMWALERFVTVTEKWTGMCATVCWVVFVSQYTNSRLHRRPTIKLCLGLLGVGVPVLWVTNGWHGLLVTDIVPHKTPFAHAELIRGPAYFALLGLNYLVLTVSYYLVFDFLLTTRTEARIRVVLLSLGAFGVGAFNVLSVARLGPVAGFNYGAYGAFPFVLFTTVGIFRLGLLDILPIARKTLVETLTDPVIVVSEDHRVADFNRTARELWPELPATTGADLANACPELATKITFPTEGEAVTDRISLPGRDGTRHYSVLVSPVQKDQNAAPVGYSILARDVTELETSRQRLERQNEHLDRVASVISHDLRNPLEVVNGYTELLDDELDDEELTSYVAKIDQSSDRMATIIEDVLTLAREGQRVDETTELDLETVARDAWENVNTDESQLIVEQSGRLWANRSRLLSIFENLFRNAVEHGCTDGNITVTVGAYEGQPGTDSSEDSGEFGFFVQDDGSGISVADSSDLFEYGFTTTDDGTGFGLSIVKTMAESHGWTLTLDEQYEDGARFVFGGVFITLEEIGDS